MRRVPWRLQLVTMISAGVVLACWAINAPGQVNQRSQDDPTLTLDELLGLEERGLARDRLNDVTELIAKLAGQEIGGGGVGGADIEELFLQAVAHMKESTLLLRELQQAGLPTQREQEEAIRKLDLLISKASQQQSSQPSQGNPQGQSQDPGSQRSDQQGRNKPGTQASRGGDNRPPLREGPLDGSLDESGLEWGGLPPRVRELLRQGRIDASARLYRRLTEAYYRRLAEENEP